MDDAEIYYSGAPQSDEGRTFLEETALSYEPIPVDTRKGEQHRPEYLAINPNAKVPAIVDGDVTVLIAMRSCYISLRNWEVCPRTHRRCAVSSYRGSCSSPAA